MSAPATPEARRLRRALGAFPTGVTIVTASHPERGLLGMTANSFASVSLDPPLVLWSVARSAPSHDPFAEVEAFAIHFLGGHHQDLAVRFAGRGASPGEKFVDVAHGPGATDAPVIAGVAPVFECRTWARYPGGDHTILVGEVVNVVEAASGGVRPEREGEDYRPLHPAGDPLVFHSGVLRRIDPPPRAGRALDEDGFARNYLAYLLARASAIVSAGFHADLKRWDLSVGEWRVLACLTDVEGLGVGELAAMALMKQPSLTKTLDRMEAGGLVERRTDPADGRRALVHLTEAGRWRVAPVLEAARAHEAQVLAPLTDAERKAVKASLDLLIARHEGVTPPRESP